jgi:2-polyprenyl-3-methyl-5-hydroxy-6-metoxy-1,4-benzoquinol methylase
LPSSYVDGKAEAISYIKEHVSVEALILDVGPGEGIWARLLALQNYHNIDCVEIWGPYVEEFGLNYLYNTVLIADVRYVRLTEKYELIILGDVLEHLTPVDGRAVLDYLKQHSKLILISVPWQYEQGGTQNPFERHLQSDLSSGMMKERYEDAEPLWMGDRIGVYTIKGQG